MNFSNSHTGSEKLQVQITYDEYAPVFKALSDPTRLKIIDMLSCGELCACKILEEFHITQPTLSYHMKILLDAGIVTANKEGKWMNYKLQKERTNKAIEFFDFITTEKDECICKK